MKNEGYLLVDHRASPGLTPEQAVRFGYHPSQVAEGKVFEAATYGCPHCGTQVVKNPLRIRPRGHCFKCNDDICDVCTIAMRAPDYVHVTMKQMADLVNSGRFTMTGHMSTPLLVPVTGDK